jgi:hypothetical protein
LQHVWKKDPIPTPTTTTTPTTTPTTTITTTPTTTIIVQYSTVPYYRQYL